jgi:phosphorylase kinase alpha/beta subunit
VPQDFYDRVWSILERTPAGIKVAGYHLPQVCFFCVLLTIVYLLVSCLFAGFLQQPTLSDMTNYELNFSLLVELMLSKIADPAYRQIIVEVSSSIT